MTELSKKFDLSERTVRFGKSIILFSKQVSLSAITTPLVVQIVKSGTSIGANYCEADCAESRKDFEHKLGICKKEARETQYWLEMILQTNPNLKKEIIFLRQEAHELQLIFITIIKKSQQNSAISR